ncbi:MAG: Asp-tRNA(Asn)/Glu-tRNA(Gln) amidotransferase subunit GatC [Candidatus Magasanikbacteria bacterium]|nr:Asp-tRNA(Asn)/Glu-tRNA(Gln) amidotransferase subunit GatC [Candidatus Magasanikbacteria bacterium]
MSISIDEVRKIAQLARIELTPEEQVRHAETISAVLDYMNILNEVDTTNVEPTFQVTGLENVYREDVVVESKLRDKLIAQMPEVEMEELVVPGVFE